MGDIELGLEDKSPEVGDRTHYGENMGKGTEWLCKASG